MLVIRTVNGVERRVLVSRPSSPSAASLAASQVVGAKDERT